MHTGVDRPHDTVEYVAVRSGFSVGGGGVLELIVIVVQAEQLLFSFDSSIARGSIGLFIPI